MTNSQISPQRTFRYRGYYYDIESGLYYLQSRYYDPEWCRFINADVFISTGQGMLGSNMFAYCLNNPIILLDSTGTSTSVNLMMTDSGGFNNEYNPKTAYKTVDDAAIAFARFTVNKTSYSRHEFGAKIYSKSSNGNTSYYLTSTMVGQPHSITGLPGISIPEGAKYEAYVHTHPVYNEISGPDKRYAQNAIEKGKGVDAYYIGPDCNLRRYSLSDQKVYDVALVNPLSLKNYQKDSFEWFRSSWEKHMLDGSCDIYPGCVYMGWPND